VIELSWEQVRAFRLARSLDGTDGLLETARRLCGVHAQVMSSAELALAARVDGLRVEDVREALWQDRALVKTWAMRGTLHLLPADDLALWAGALRTRSHLWRSTAWTRYFGVSVEELETLVAAIGTSLDGEGRTREELGEAVGKVAGEQARELMASGWGTLLKPVAGEGGLVFGPNRGRNVAFVNPHVWIGPFEPLPTEDAMREMVRRWLRVYGPGSHEDFARWWGVAPGRARKHLEPLADELVEVSVEGRRTFALAADRRALRSAKAHGPARLLAGFDPYVVGFFPREGLVEDEFLARVSRTAGWISPVVVVGGRTAGVWQHKLKRGTMEITIEPFGKLAASRRRELEADAERLAAALGATPAVRVAA
jgi:Winged helix DNA-binding domain